MRKLLAVLSLLIAAGFCALSTPAQSISPFHNVGGIYYSQAYSKWQATVFGGPYASGSATLIIYPAYVTLPDGYAFSPFSTSVPITVGLGTANQETETPSAVSVGPCPAGMPATQPCASVTATWTYTHGQGDLVNSGSQGIEDAIYDATNAGGGLVFFQVDCGPVTLSTSGATTTISACQVPKSYLSMGGSAYVETTVTTATSYSLGISGSTTSFINACTSLTAGTHCEAFAAKASPVNSTVATYVLTPLLITASTTAGAGVVHVRAWGYTPAQSAN